MKDELNRAFQDIGIVAAAGSIIHRPDPHGGVAGMTNRQRLGYAILASPFLAIFVLAVMTEGILIALSIFTAVAVVVAAVLIGAELVA